MKMLNKSLKLKAAKLKRDSCGRCYIYMVLKCGTVVMVD